jgi:hypothetical protein
MYRAEAAAPIASPASRARRINILITACNRAELDKASMRSDLGEEQDSNMTYGRLFSAFCYTSTPGVTSALCQHPLFHAPSGLPYGKVCSNVAHIATCSATCTWPCSGRSSQTERQNEPACAAPTPSN